VLFKEARERGTGGALWNPLENVPIIEDHFDPNVSSIGRSLQEPLLIE